MIRSIVLLQFKPDTTEEQIAGMLDGAEAMLAKRPGVQGYTLRRDLGLRDGNMSLAALIDFEDEDAYLAYIASEEHTRFSREVVGPIRERSVRCQIRVS
ncbi:MAG: Dabb family protein [Chloroflexota bacterium]|nr:Dabb family protein [Chloroflexota bacterium]